MGEPERISNVAAATSQECVFKYDLENATPGQKYQLLTIGGITTYGEIRSLSRAREMGIIAYFEVPVRNKDLEEKLGYMMPRRKVAKVPETVEELRRGLWAGISEQLRKLFGT